MKVIIEAKTTKQSYAEKRNETSSGCDHIKCKLCEY